VGILIVGGLVAIGLWSWLASRAGGHGGPARSPRAQTRGRSAALGRRSSREIIERREELEAEDLAQMLEASNAWRRRRGRSERTVEDVELLLAAEARDARRRHERPDGRS